MHVVCPLIVFSLLLAALGDSQSLSKCNTSALGCLACEWYGMINKPLLNRVPQNTYPQACVH